MITFSRNLLVRIYDTSILQLQIVSTTTSISSLSSSSSTSSTPLSFANIPIPCIRSWKGHRLPVLTADVDPTSTLLASGSNDRSILVWDIEKGYSTHNFRGHESIITCVRFQPDSTMVQRLASASEDGNVRLWDLVSSSLLISINEHYSTVTSIIFSNDASGYYMITGGRDKVLNIWDTRDFQGEGDKATLINTALKATVPTNESIEGMVMFPTSEPNSTVTMATKSDTGKEIVFATAGNRGLLRIWKLVVQGTQRNNRTYGCGCIGVRNGKDIRQILMNQHDSTTSNNNFTAKDTINQIITNATTGDDTTVPLSSQFQHLLIHFHPVGSAKFSNSGSSKSASSSSSTIPNFTTQAYNFDLFTATRDQLLSIIRVNTLKSVKNIAGFHDQFTDVKYIPRPFVSSSSSSSSAAVAPSPQRLLAVATNSEQLRIVNADTFSTTLCEGHTDIVLSVAPSPDGTLVASSSKDHTVRVWDVATGICVGICAGHTEAVGTLSFPMKANNFIRAVSSHNTKDTYLGTNGWLVSGSKDRTLKLWQLSTLLAKLPSPRPETWNPYTDIVIAGDKQKTSNLPYHARTSAAVVAHEKDINAVAVAPNDKLIASASQDKTIKLWSVPDLGLIATLRGHKRGVWSIAFSPADQILASASGDNTIRLWAVAPSAGYNCFRTFEGHDSSVLSVRFIRQGTQLLSVGADGLLKLWNTNETAECINTFDAHSDKIWALAVRPTDMNTLEDAVDDTTTMNDNGQGGHENKKIIPNYEVQIVTAGADSILNIWRDVTSATATGEIEAAEEALIKQQNLFNAMAMRDYTKAITLTLELDQPGRCGDILQELLEIGPTPPAHAPNKDERFRQMMLKEVRSLQSVDTTTVENRQQVQTLVENGHYERSMVSGLNDEGRNMLLGILENLTAGQMMTLLNYIREWNTQSRHGSLAQNVLYLILKYLPRGHLLAILTEIKNQEHRRSFATTSGNVGNTNEDDDDDMDTNARNMVTKVLPGVGTIKVPTAPSALSRENKLTPVANNINNYGDELTGLLNLSTNNNGNNSGSSNSTVTRPSTLAAAELRGLIATLLPYTQRHLDRLDRLQISTYLVDTTVYAMRGLLPNDKETLAEEEDSRQRLLGEGIHKKVTATIIPGTKRAYNDDDSDTTDDDDNDDEEDYSSGKGWLGTVVVPSSSSEKRTTTIGNDHNRTIVASITTATSTTDTKASQKANQKKRVKVTNSVISNGGSNEQLDDKTVKKDAPSVRQSGRLRNNTVGIKK